MTVEELSLNTEEDLDHWERFSEKLSNLEGVVSQLELLKLNLSKHNFNHELRNCRGL